MDKVRVEIDGDPYWVEGGNFDDMLDGVRGIAGRHFDREERVWKLPCTPREAARALLPFRLMYEEDDALSSSQPIRVHPD